MFTERRNQSPRHGFKIMEALFKQPLYYRRDARSAAVYSKSWNQYPKAIHFKQFLSDNHTLKWKFPDVTMNLSIWWETRFKNTDVLAVIISLRATKRHPIFRWKSFSENALGAKADFSWRLWIMSVYRFTICRGSCVFLTGCEYVVAVDIK